MRLRGEELDTAYFATLRAGEGRPNTRPGAAAAGRVGRGPEAPEARGARNHRGARPLINCRGAICRRRRRVASVAGRPPLIPLGGFMVEATSRGVAGQDCALLVAPGRRRLAVRHRRSPLPGCLRGAFSHKVAYIRQTSGCCADAARRRLLRLPGPQGASPAPAAGMDSGPLVKRSRRMSRPRLPVSSICGRKSLQTYICL